MAKNNPLDTVVETERELYLMREENSMLKSVIAEKDRIIQRLSTGKAESLAEVTLPIADCLTKLRQRAKAKSIEEAKNILARFGFPLTVLATGKPPITLLDAMHLGKSLTMAFEGAALPITIERDPISFYRAARRSLAFEQEQHTIFLGKDEHHPMRVEFHDAIKRVRLLAVEIADVVTGYKS